MKKLFLILSTLFLIQFVQAQSCKCNPNGFNPFTYSYQGETSTVRTLNQFNVKCKTPIKLDGGYKCNYTTVCDVKFKAVVKNGAGVIISTIPSFNFPWEYQFDAAGSYTLEITPYCAGKTCPPAKFYFTVSCDAPQTCKCNPKNSWNMLTSVIDGEKNELKCGDTVKIKNGQKFGITGAYKCEGNCNAILKGSVVNEDTGDTQNFESITLDGHPLDFLQPGKYKLIITPVCNDSACEPCIFYVTVY